MQKKPLRVAFHNLGCKVNSYETEAMLEKMLRQGYVSVPFEEEADIYVVNTCSVTNIADRKSRQMLHRAKAMNPDAVVAAVGCYAQAAGEALLRDKAVDIVIGNDRKSELPFWIEKFLEEREKTAALCDIGASRSCEELDSTGAAADRTRAYLKIEDGCNQFCTYCLIPHIRGRVRRRRPEEIIREAEGLTASGFKELVLTGIHVSSYGIDFPGDAAASGYYGKPLLELLAALDAVPGLERLRLSSLEPRVITRESAAFMASLRHLCPHFHLSLQSGSDPVLKRMGRRYTAEEFYEEMLALREAFGSPALTTDVIVGFPGETEEYFEETLRFLEKACFYETHVFRYSRRKGTAADRMPDQIPEPVKAERSSRLLALNRKNKAAFETNLLGKSRSVLLAQPAGDGLWTGFTPEYVRLTVPAPDGASGMLRDVVVTEAMLPDKTGKEVKE